MKDGKAPRAERDQTDESLRLERERADDALGEHESAAEAKAADVLELARTRADSLLADARASTDEVAVGDAPAPSSSVVDRERQVADRTVREERRGADERLRAQRARLAEHLADHRDETDKDLFTERARSDGAVETRDEFLGFVSHDLRGMLNAIVGFASIIEREVDAGDPLERVREHARRIQRCGLRMARLVEDLVDVASIEAGKLAVNRELFDAAQIASEAFELVQDQATERGISLVREFGPPLLATFDPARILQVLSNLLTNAVKFTPQDGTVVVRLDQTGDELRFTVRDTGPGIAPDKLETIFERFVQVVEGDRRGVGLGLFISKCIVQGHGGRIWAESRGGEGSVVSFSFPIPGPHDVTDDTLEAKAAS